MRLTVSNSTDPDRDHLYYSFALYADDNLEEPLVEVQDLQPGNIGETSWRVPRQLSVGQGYTWQAKVTDEHELAAASEWASFTVKESDPVVEILPPMVIAPSDGAELPADTDEVELVAAANGETSAVALTYRFELDTSADFDSADKVASDAIEAPDGEARWSVPLLEDNTRYYWRVRADDGQAKSVWASADFMIQSADGNTAPALPVVNRPLDGATLDVRRPFFDLNPVEDAEGNAVVYEFELYSDAALTGLVAEVSGVQPYWQLQESLVAGTPYYWRYRALDSLGNTSGWSSSLSFAITDAGAGKPPSMEPVEADGEYHVPAGFEIPIQWVDEDPDSSAEIALYYSRGNGRGGKRRLIVAGLPEDADGEGDTYLWDTTGVKPGRYQLEAEIQDEGGVKTIGPWGSVNILRWRCSRKPSEREKQTNFGGKPRLPGFDTPCNR